MIETRGNEIYRSGIRIGWLEGSHVYDHERKQLGYFTANGVYNTEGELIAKIEGDYVYFGGKRDRLEDVIDSITAVGLSNPARVAILSFLGE